MNPKSLTKASIIKMLLVFSRSLSRARSFVLKQMQFPYHLLIINITHWHAIKSNPIQCKASHVECCTSIRSICPYESAFNCWDSINRETLAYTHTCMVRFWIANRFWMNLSDYVASRCGAWLVIYIIDASCFLSAPCTQPWCTFIANWAKIDLCTLHIARITFSHCQLWIVNWTVV